MNAEINEKISHLVDGELHHSEEEPMLQKIRQQPELHNKLSRYQAVSHVLKTDDFIMANQNFLEKINQEIKDEPHYFLPQLQENKVRGLRWKMTSAAIAASIVLVAVIVSKQTDYENTDLPQEVIASNELVTETKNQTTKIAQLSQHERFKAYLQAHSDDLYTYGSLNYQPHATVANFGQE